MVLYLARRCSGLSLRQLGELVGGLEYKTVGKAIERMGQRLEHDKPLQAVASRLMKRMSHEERGHYG